VFGVHLRNPWLDLAHLAPGAILRGAPGASGSWRVAGLF